MNVSSPMDEIEKDLIGGHEPQPEKKRPRNPYPVTIHTTRTFYQIADNYESGPTGISFRKPDGTRVFVSYAHLIDIETEPVRDY